MNPGKARVRLLAQHEWLRAMLRQTRALARRLAADDPVTGAMAASMRELCEAYAHHNAYERSLLEPILRHADGPGPARVARMSEEHRAEHAALEELRAGADLEVALRFDDVADLLDAHLAAEERTFLSTQVLRDDALTEGGGVRGHS